MNTQPFVLDDGTEIYIETTDAHTGMQRVGRGGKAEEKAAQSFTGALKHIRPAAQAMLDTFKDINTPAEINLEFAVKFSAELGCAILASTKGEATFKVGLKWKNPEPAKPDNAS